LQYASSFTPTISDNGPAVNQDHDDDHDDDDDFYCDPEFEDCEIDSDGDGSPDWDDDCPNTPGTYENYGCPEGVEPDDSDGDGVPDYEDECPNEYGSWEFMGCPEDEHVDLDPDHDGIVNEYDECPNEYGTQSNGCPEVEEPDSDGDGVPDDHDNCPNEYGTRTDGCPQEVDSDGDGVPDSQDNCPNIGNADQADFNNDGSGDVCSDADGDGYYDSFDQCPLEYAYADPNDDGCLDDVAEPPSCDPSYPDVCIAPYPPDLDCGEIGYSNFRVVGSDPHGFDGDNDGIGCEVGSPENL